MSETMDITEFFEHAKEQLKKGVNEKFVIDGRVYETQGFIEKGEKVVALTIEELTKIAYQIGNYTCSIEDVQNQIASSMDGLIELPEPKKLTPQNQQKQGFRSCKRVDRVWGGRK